MSENENGQVEATEAEGVEPEAESAEATTPEGEAEGRQNRRKIRVGVVTSDKMDKTVTVSVERRFAHPLYGKGVTRSKRYQAHDENNEFTVGDKVRIMETRPLSKTKRWRVVELIERAS